MDNLASALEALQQEHLFRTRNLNSSAQEIEPVINGQQVLSFCSNDYLGLANHPKVIESFASATKKYGVGSGASHLITGHHKCHHTLEDELAEFLGCERALLFSTGYMANLGVVSSFANRDAVVFEDRLNHASLIDAGILSRANLKRYTHVACNELETQLKNDKNHSKFIISDGVFSMDGTIAPVTKLQLLAEKYSAQLIIDDAHGIGVLGDSGKGCTEGRLNKNTILIGTLGKAFGTFGAFVAANKEIIEWLIQKARTYIYTTALPPAIAEATRTSLKLIQEETWRREKLRNLILQFRSLAEQKELPLTSSTTAIQPLIVGSSEMALNLSENLLENGILVMAIRPPTVAKNQARLRVTFSATHTQTHVERLVEVISKAYKQYNL